MILFLFFIDLGYIALIGLGPIALPLGNPGSCSDTDSISFPLLCLINVRFSPLGDQWQIVIYESLTNRSKLKGHFSDWLTSHKCMTSISEFSL